MKQFVCYALLVLLLSACDKVKSGLYAGYVKGEYTGCSSPTGGAWTISYTKGGRERTFVTTSLPAQFATYGTRIVFRIGASSGTMTCSGNVLTPEEYSVYDVQELEN